MTTSKVSQLRPTKLSLWRAMALGFTVLLLGVILLSAFPQAALAADCTFKSTTEITCGSNNFTGSGTTFPMTFEDTATSGGQCAEFNLKVASASATSATYTTYTAHPGVHDVVTCTANTSQLTLGSSYQTASGGSGGTGTSTATPTLTCNSGLNPLNWILCAAVSGMVGIANGLDGLINGELSIGTNHDSGTDGTPTAIFGPCASTGPCAYTGYYAAWSSFRDIALALLVIVALIVILSTALGLEFLDAYTIRKILPRLIIIAIAISLSWNLLEFFITLTNDLGYGIRYIIYEPFAGMNLGLNLGGGTGVAVDLIGGAAITALGTFGLLLFAASAAITVAAGLVMLILRQVLVTGLIIIAPVALVCYILPNTQKYYSQYAQLLGRAAVMGAIFEAVIAFGRVGAALAATDGSVVNQFAAFIMYFGVYILIFSRGWQWGGAGMAAIGGAVSKSTEGVQGSIHKRRSENTSANIKKARAGQRWNEDFGRFKNPFASGGRFMQRTDADGNVVNSKFSQTKFGQGVQKHVGKFNSIGNIGNRMAVNAFDQDELARYRYGKSSLPGGGRYSALVNEQIADSAMHASIEGYQEIQKNGPMHYKAYQAISGEGMKELDTETQERLSQAGFQGADGRYRAPTSLNDFEKVAEIMTLSSDEKTRTAGAQLERNAGALATIKSKAGMEYADISTIGLLGAAADGRASGIMISNVHNKMVDSGNGDLAYRAATQAQNIGAAKRPDIRAGHGLLTTVDHSTGNTYLRSTFDKTSDAVSKTAVDAVMSIKRPDWTGAKAEAIDAQAKTIRYIAGYSGTDGVMLQKRNQMRRLISDQSGPYAQAEPDALIRWENLGRELGIPPSTTPPTE